MNKTIPFAIDHLDPLGQGVSRRVNEKKQNTITFIPKTLPHEQGMAKVIKSSKGVEFAELSTLTKTATQRIEPECPHFAQCPGCDYLHVSYTDEIIFKKNALLFLLRNFSLQGSKITENNIELIAAARRFHYRNRVQLHYRHKYLGLINSHTDQVLEIPQCRLVSEQLKKTIDQLYADKSWAAEQRSHGHVEIYERDDAIEMQWNQPYAHGGFSQVNPQMNLELKKWLSHYFENIPFSRLLDLFSGNGNLSDDLVNKDNIQRQMVDMSPLNAGKSAGLSVNDSYMQLNLFDEDALDSFARRSRFKQADVLLLDPPRKGFPSLAQWVAQLKPACVAYVSCNAATLSRDLQTIVGEQKKQSYSIDKVVLLDMFPGTRHFETIVTLRKN